MNTQFCFLKKLSFPKNGSYHNNIFFNSHVINHDHSYISSNQSKSCFQNKIIHKMFQSQINVDSVRSSHIFAEQYNHFKKTYINQNANENKYKTEIQFQTEKFLKNNDLTNKQKNYRANGNLNQDFVYQPHKKHFRSIFTDNSSIFRHNFHIQKSIKTSNAKNTTKSTKTSRRTSSQHRSRLSCQKLLFQTKKTLYQFTQRRQWFKQQINKIKLQKQTRKSPLKSLDLSKVLRLKNKFQQNNTIIKLQQRSSFTRRKSFKKELSNQNFKIIKKIGSGTFGQVYLAIQVYTGLVVALKKMKKSLFKNNNCLDQLVTQVKIQLFLDNPNVLKIYGFYFDQENVNLIIQYMNQGNLYKKMKQKQFLTEVQASKVLHQILFGLKSTHQNRIVHRDIKPQNVVINFGVYKLCDFGTAAICQNRRNTACGTLDYNAPEMVQGKQYQFSLDRWSIGVLLFQLLNGKPPFYHSTKKNTVKKIVQYRNGSITYYKQISIMAVNYISKFLLKNPEQRININQAIQHKFIQNFKDSQIAQLIQNYDIQVQKTNEFK